MYPHPGIVVINITEFLRIFAFTSIGRNPEGLQYPRFHQNINVTFVIL